LTRDVVDTPEGLAEAVARIAAGDDVIAVDTERASGHRYGQRAFLIQLRQHDVGTVLVDPEALADLEGLAAVLGEREWILHSATQDLPCLNERGLYPGRLFDTELAARILGMEKVGLAALTETLLGVELAKGFGAADWSKRPLPDDWLEYASLDVEYLEEMREILIDRLKQEGRWEWASAEFETLLDFRPKANPEPWRRTSGMHQVRDPRGREIVRQLWLARDEVARELDRAPHRVLNDTMIVAVAKQRPASEAEVRRVPGFRSVRRKEVWLRAVERAQQTPESELPGPAEQSGPPAPKNWKRKHPDAAQRLTDLKAATRVVADELGIPPEVLIPPAAVRALAWQPPAELSLDAVTDHLAASGARSWQIALVGQPLMEALQQPVA